MRKVKVDVGFAFCEYRYTEEVIEIPDDMTDDELEELIHETRNMNGEDDWVDCLDFHKRGECWLDGPDITICDAVDSEGPDWRIEDGKVIETDQFEKERNSGA